jgi:hypothetical protein
MSLNVSRTTEPLSFNTGIGSASFAEVMDSPVSGETQKKLLPGSTTVTQAVDALFPTERAVGDEIMAALVAGNTALLRTPGGFNEAARDTLKQLLDTRTEASARAAAEIETLLADTDLFEHYRMALLET